MKRLFFVFFSVLILSISGCSLNDDDPNFHFEPVPIISADLPESFELNGEYQISVTYELPNGCTSFWDWEVVQKERATRNVAVFGIVKTDQETCVQATNQETRAFTFRVLYNEDYIFRFWQGENVDGEQQYFEVEVPIRN